jgi:putative ABC transport system permease protein
LLNTSNQKRGAWYWFYQSLLEASAQIYAHKTRSLLTALGIIIAVSGVVTVIAVMQGLEQGVNKALSQLGAETILIRPNYFKRYSPQDGPRESITMREFNIISKNVPHLAAMSAAQQVESEYSGAGITYKSQKVMAQVMAVTENFPSLYQQFPNAGRFIMTSDQTAHHRVCVISEHIAQKLGVAHDPLDKLVKIKGQNFRVIGVMPNTINKSGTMLSDVYIPLSIALEPGFGSDDIEIAFRIVNIEERENILNKLRQLLRQTLQTKPGEADDFHIEDAESLRNVNKEIIAMISTVLLVVVSISLLIGGIGIMNMMLVSVMERTKEIGVLRSLGATRNQIRSRFLIEASLLSTFGGVLGILLGYLISLLVTTFIPAADHASLPLWAILLTLGVAMGTGIISGSLPAEKAAALDPVEALAHE